MWTVSCSDLIYSSIWDGRALELLTDGGVFVVKVVHQLRGWPGEDRVRLVFTWYTKEEAAARWTPTASESDAKSRPTAPG